MRRRLKAMSWLMLVGTVGAGLLLGGEWVPRRRAARDRVPNIESVRELSQLTTVRVLLADVQTSRVEGLAGGAEADLLVRGEFCVSTDLSRARFESVDPVAHTAVLALPRPTASPPRIDHGRSRVVRVRQTGIWAVLPGDDAQVAVLNSAFRDAERQLAGGGGDGDRDEYRALARRRTEDVLKTFFARVGWSVTVRWQPSG